MRQRLNHSLNNMTITPDMTIEEALQQAKAEEYGAKELIRIASLCLKNGLITFQDYHKISSKFINTPFQ